MAHADPFWSAPPKVQPPCQLEMPNFIGFSASRRDAAEKLAGLKPARPAISTAL
jgi:hypothetical protein